MDEPFNQYVTVLHQMAARCEHDKITPDELLRDRIIFRIVDGKVTERLLREGSQKDTNGLKLGEMSVNAVETKMRLSSSETVSNQPKAVMIRDCNFCGHDHECSKTACPGVG